MLDAKQDRTLVVIVYKASTPGGESMYCPGEIIKKTTDKDIIEFNFDFKYILDSIVFTKRFLKLRREVREKIIEHVLKTVLSGELVNKEKIQEYMVRFVWTSDYFEENNVVEKKDMFVSWVESHHIDSVEIRDLTGIMGLTR